MSLRFVAGQPRTSFRSSSFRMRKSHWLQNSTGLHLLLSILWQQNDGSAISEPSLNPPDPHAGSLRFCRPFFLILLQLWLQLFVSPVMLSSLSSKLSAPPASAECIGGQLDCLGCMALQGPCDRITVLQVLQPTLPSQLLHRPFLDGGRVQQMHHLHR